MRPANHKLAALSKQDRAIQSSSVISYLAPRPSVHCAAPRRTQAGSHISHDLSLSALVLQPGRSPPARGRGSKLSIKPARCSSTASPPARGRGSKQNSPYRRARVGRRPLRGGADRNLPYYDNAANGKSPPARGRGSKHKHIGVFGSCCPSPPARGRGSKLLKGERSFERSIVAPCAGRGSNSLVVTDIRPGSSRPLRGGADRTVPLSVSRTRTLSPPARGRGSKQPRTNELRRMKGRPLRGGADRNIQINAGEAFL